MYNKYEGLCLLSGMLTLSGKHFNFECSVSHLIQNLFLELVVVPPKTLPSIPLSAET